MTLPAANPVGKQAAEAQEATFRSERILLRLLCLMGEESLRLFAIFIFSTITHSPPGICVSKKFHWTNFILFLFFIVKWKTRLET
jgi:hypothetical protein